MELLLVQAIILSSGVNLDRLRSYVKPYKTEAIIVGSIASGQIETDNFKIKVTHNETKVNLKFDF